MLRVSLIHLLLLVAIAGLALAALLGGNEVWRQILFLLTSAVLFVSALAALAWEGDERRWFAIGFVLAGALAFWSASSDSPQAIRRVPLQEATAEFFHARHIERRSTDMGDGARGYLTESGTVVILEQDGSKSFQNQTYARRRGYPVTNLKNSHGRKNFQQIADYVATLVLAYLGGVAGVLVRRARRSPETPPD